MLRRSPLPLFAVALVAFAAGVRASKAPLPGPAPQEERAAGHDAPTENGACEACHTDIAAEWRGSLHHRAWDDGVFQTAYAIEPQAFCRACHVPEAEPASVPSEGARRLGVGCVTCHVAGGQVTSAHALPAGKGPHAVVGDARLGTAAACGRCHQFDFPEPQDAPMQGTGDEHRASPQAAESCQKCHMPLARGEDGRWHRSHDFKVIGNKAMLRSAVSARAWRGGDRTIVLSLGAANAGHAFPTGDMFRRLEVRARVAGEGGARARPVVLARRFEMAAGSKGVLRVQTGDDRLSATGAAQAIELDLGVSIAGQAVRWEVAYQRMSAGMASMFGVDPAADEVIVAEGVLPPKRRPQTEKP